MLKRGPFQIAPGFRLAGLPFVFGFPQPVHPNTNLLHRIGHDRILPNPLQFITHHTPVIDGIQFKTVKDVCSAISHKRYFVTSFHMLVGSGSINPDL